MISCLRLLQARPWSLINSAAAMQAGVQGNLTVKFRKNPGGSVRSTKHCYWNWTTNYAGKQPWKILVLIC